MSANPLLRRCAIYTRKSSEEGLEQSFNSLDAQREACAAYIASQAHEGWQLIDTQYDDGGFSGGTLTRPALQHLMQDITSNKIDIVVVYKLDRLSRSLSDFVRLIDEFDDHSVSFVSITQQFNTSTSMGRLTLNVLLSFAQFEREVTGERIRDKIGASRKKGMWTGGTIPLGYDLKERALVKNSKEAKQIQYIFKQYLKIGCVRRLKEHLDQKGMRSKSRPVTAKVAGSRPLSRGMLYSLLKNPLYAGKVHYQGVLYEGEHQAVVDQDTWQAVQDQLSGNRHRARTRTEAKFPSLLAGRITDECGNRLSPTYTQRKGRRYAYYINQALLQYRENQAGEVHRVSAKQVDERVDELITDFLINPARVLEALGAKTLDAAKTEQTMVVSHELGNAWSSASLTDRIEWLDRLNVQVVVTRNKITLSLPIPNLIATLSAWPKRPTSIVNRSSDHSVDPSIELSVNVSLQRRGIEKKLVVANSTLIEEKAHPRSVLALQHAVLKALKWNEELLSGKVGSIKALVERDNLNRRQVYRLRKLAFLAPDIIERIAEGNIPPTFNLEKLKQDFPLDWPAQRTHFGFPQPLSRESC